MHTTTPSFLCWNGVMWMFCLGWLCTAILPLSACWVVTITGGSHLYLASIIFLILAIRNLKTKYIYHFNIMKNSISPYNSGTWEDKSGGLWVQGQPWLHSKTLPQKNKLRNRNIIICSDLYTENSKILLRIIKDDLSKRRDMSYPRVIGFVIKNINSMQSQSNPQKNFLGN
jgi:hypothetical protein